MSFNRGIFYYIGINDYDLDSGFYTSANNYTLHYVACNNIRELRSRTYNRNCMVTGGL